jgi:hypothetical protein
MLFTLVVGLDLIVGPSPGRRPAGEWMLVILAIAIVGLSWSGRRPRAVVSWLLIISLCQALLLGWMLIHGIGTPLVTAILNGLFLAAWLVAAAFAWRAT